jgi:hypothetical protein
MVTGRPVNLEAERAAIAREHTAAGVAAVTLDPSTLPPYVLPALPFGAAGFAAGYHSHTFTVKIVAAPPGNLDAWQWIAAQLDAVLGALRWETYTTGTEAVGDKDLPAAFVVVTRESETC